MLNPFADIQWRPNRDELREFARSLMIGFPILAAVFLAMARWKTGAWPLWPFWMGGAGVALGAILRLLPSLARPLYVAWHAIGGAIGFVVSNTLLVLVFYGIITPIGLLLRMLGKDPLERRWNPAASTYWKAAAKSMDARDYFRQF